VNAPSARRTIEAYYTAVDAGDVRRVVELFSEDAWYERPGYDRFVGRTELRAFYNTTRIIDSGRHTVSTLVHDDSHSHDTVAVEGVFDGQLKDGREVSLGFADFFVLDGELIRGRRTYFYAPLV
jgi:steroid delta-isomerase